MKQLRYGVIQPDLVQILRKSHSELPLDILRKVGIAQKHLIGEIIQGYGLIKIHLDELGYLMLSGIVFVSFFLIAVVFLTEEKIGSQNVQKFVKKTVEIDNVPALIVVFLGDNLSEDPTHLIVCLGASSCGVAPEEHHALLHHGTKFGIGKMNAGSQKVAFGTVGMELVHVDDKKVVLVQAILLILKGKLGSPV
jgi:hypothetical protein